MKPIDSKACADGAHLRCGRRAGGRAGGAPRRPVQARRQRGISTILVMLMLGLGVGVSALGAFHVLDGAQQRQLSVHATAPAQATAWRGVELVRRYLEVLDPAALQDWVGTGAALSVGGNLGVTARVTEVVEVAGSGMVGPHFRVTAEVGGVAAQGGTAQTTSTVQVVYKVRALESGEDPPTTPPGAIIPAATINTDFRIGGTLDIKSSGGGAIAMNVDGDVDSHGNVKLGGVDILRATGSVSLDTGGIHLDRIHANGDVLLEKGASAAQIESRGKVSVSGTNKITLDVLSIRSHGDVVLNNVSVGMVETRANLLPGTGVVLTNGLAQGVVTWTATDGRAGMLHANGNVAYNGLNVSTSLRSRSDVTVASKDGGADKVHANGNVSYAGKARATSIHALGNAALIDSSGAGVVHSKGDITVAKGNVGEVQGEKKLSVGTGSVDAGTVGGTVTPANSSKVKVNSVPGHQVSINEVSVVSVDEVQEVSTRVTIDVYPLRAASNYVFEQVDGNTRVTVGKIAGIEDGEYWLVGAYLCAVPGAIGGTCADAKQVARICEAGPCITRTDNGWSISGITLARGVVWFDGDLGLEKGTYLNTFIATGDIVTKVDAMAPNYAGYAATCQNAPVDKIGLGQVAAFNPLVPTNLCDVSAGKMVPNPLGNVVYLSGGYVPSTSSAGAGTFTGGNIKLNVNDSQNRSTYGAVMAANDIQLTGNNTIHGSVTVGAQGGLEEVHWTGNTVIDLTGGSEDYAPGELPCMVGCAPPLPPDDSAVSTVLWTRYL